MTDQPTTPVPDPQPDLEPSPDGHVHQHPYDDADEADTGTDVGERPADLPQTGTAGGTAREDTAQRATRP